MAAMGIPQYFFADRRKTANQQALLIEDLYRQLQTQRTEMNLMQVQSRQAEMKLRHAATALMTAQEEERKRIALDLHDSIGQALSALSFGVGGTLDLCRRGDIESAVDMLQRLGVHVKDTLEEVRRISHDLRPAMLDDLGIIGTMSWFIREFHELNANLAVHSTITVEESDVPTSLRTPMYRVLQEASSNIISHSDATDVWITLARRGQLIVLEIRDNGRGFEINADNTCEGKSRVGIGLDGMRDRVECSGGEFRAKSIHGQGTLIRARWALWASETGQTKY